MVGAHPDDEDTFLISWLSRGRHVETAYLSLTRGDGGQNLIGNELGEALGVLRTEELLAARRVDGARQYFTRAYDFGFSKDTIDTYRHWPKDSILGDVIRVVRAFRPHVIIGVFSGTPRDGHGHHQVSGLLAREAYDVAGDTTRYSPVFGEPWTPLKFYRSARFNADAGTLRIDVGEFSPLLGRSYAEIAGESRSQHKSQGFGTLERKGPVFAHLRRETSRVNHSETASAERSLFDGIDTSWARFRPSVVEPRARRALDSLPAAFAAVRAHFDPFAPKRLLGPLAHVARLIAAVCPMQRDTACGAFERSGDALRVRLRNGDLFSSLNNARIRVERARRQATGIAIEANSIELMPLGQIVPVLVWLYNRGPDTIAVGGGLASGQRQPLVSITRFVAPGGVLRDTLLTMVDSVSQPWWLIGGGGRGRSGGVFTLPGSEIAENARPSYPAVAYPVDLGGSSFGEMVTFIEPVTFRFADDVKGEIRRHASGVPAITITLGELTAYAPANTAIQRTLEVRARTADPMPREAKVSLTLPAGLTADSASRTVRFERYDEERILTFRIRGRLLPGEHRITAVAESDGESFTTGYATIDYDHIRRQRMYRPAAVSISAVDVRVPAGIRVAYVRGVSDNVAPMLEQLGIPVSVIPAGEIAGADLQRYTTVVIGPRAYEAHPELAAANPRLLDFARNGGTLVVQYGQYEMTRPDIMPYPITLARPHDRVTHEDAPVTILQSNAQELQRPNRIGPADFEGWVQERGLYMPRTFDDRYRAPLSMSDPGEPPNGGAILVAPVGEGLYVYTSLAFFRQLPAGVPGAARLFVNLLSAGIVSRTRP